METIPEMIYQVCLVLSGLALLLGVGPSTEAWEPGQRSHPQERMLLLLSLSFVLLYNIKILKILCLHNFQIVMVTR